MCGIAGSIDFELSNSDADLINHRGPDSRGFAVIAFGDKKVYLAHTRLSIQDLSNAGNQPMFTDCGNYCIIFNGEIYNHRALRSRLVNIKFRGHSDTETILYYFREFGINGVKDLNGIFAFAFIDKLKGKVFLARDWFGVKPLYYFIEKDKLLFSSELRVILNNSALKKEIDELALDTLLSFRYNPAPQTLFKGIRKLEAAMYLEFDIHGLVHTTKYWQKDQSIDYSITEQDAVCEYGKLLDQAVQRQLLSDVPIGLLLSGGVDSAVLAVLISKFTEYRVKTFTIGFQGEGSYNELEGARKISKLVNSEHYETLLDTKTFIDSLHRVFYYAEEPIAEPSMPALYHLSALASRHVKVVLSGQGVDEPMAGYKRYRGERFLSSYQTILSKLPVSLISDIFPHNSNIERGVYSSQFKDELDRFVAIYTLFTPEQKRALFRTEFHNGVNRDQRHLFSSQYEHSDKSADSLSKMLFIDTRRMLPDSLLLFNDKMTMANSLENRVPYLDIDLINFVESLPIKLKLNGLTDKYIHRKNALRFLPHSTVMKKKIGFETPVGNWFKQDLSNFLIDLVDSSSSLSRKYFNLDFIKKMIRDHQTSKRDNKHHLFILLSLELWYANFFRT